MIKSRVLAFVVVTTFTASCATNTQGGALIGAAGGGAVGALIGNQAGNTAAGAIIGAAVGGAAGAFIGNYMDRQAAEMERDLEGATIERVGEGIKITFDSGILFAVNQANLQGEAVSNLNELATILKKYEDTNVLVEGHTDSSGEANYNLALSERRARSVVNHMTSVQVAGARMQVMAYGEDQPVADNSTSAGRTQNRRVEVAIWANDKLKREAENRS
jgi:outer membrane protein OmpA-like peptidoglycan-associated protein